MLRLSVHDWNRRARGFGTADSMEEKSARAFVTAKYSRFMREDGMRLYMAGKRIVGEDVSLG
jgi:hypothetical protein